MTGWESVAAFEKAISEYTGAPYVTCVNGCTAAIRLALKYLRFRMLHDWTLKLSIPAKTYPSIPMLIIGLGFGITYDGKWEDGCYSIYPKYLYDSARYFNKNMFHGSIMCVSFHPEKPFGLEGGGGAILHSDPVADQFYKEIRFHARREGIPTNQDDFRYWQYADDCRMWPATAQAGIQKLAIYAKHDHPPMLEGIEDYPDCSKLFGGT